MTFRMLSATFFRWLLLDGDTVVILRRLSHIYIGLMKGHPGRGHGGHTPRAQQRGAHTQGAAVWGTHQSDVCVEWLPCRHLAVVVWRRLLIAIETSREEKGKLTLK